MFYKINVPKKFAKFTENYLCWSLFLIKLQSWDLQLYYKENPEHLKATASQFRQELKTNVKKDAIIPTKSLCFHP